MNQLKRDLNRPIKRVSIAVLVLFLILLVNANYLQAVDAPSLATGRSTTAPRTTTARSSAAIS